MIQLFKTPSAFRTSLEERIRRESAHTGQDIQRIRRHVAYERLLARLFHDGDISPFALKGGYAMELRLGTKARATLDVDMAYHLMPSDAAREIQESLRLRTELDMGDYFHFRFGPPKSELNGPTYGGSRYVINALVDGRRFEQFQLDVGIDVVIKPLEVFTARDRLGYCGIQPPVIRMIGAEQQFAEKVHAYTLPRFDRENTRVKDLVDMVLLPRHRTLDPALSKKCLKRVFDTRGTHDMPKSLSTPSDKWTHRFQIMATECGLQLSMEQAFEETKALYARIIDHPD